MPGQKALTEFFRPLNSGGVKRPLSESTNATVPTLSKATEERVTEDGERPSTPLTPEGKKRMLSNQLIARIKLQSHRTSALHSSIGETWFRALEPEFQKPYFSKLSEFLTTERSRHTIFPPESQVWSWTQHFEIQNTKVVIIGQDPYHGLGQAHGLCFSVLKGVPPPPSLVNIYKELAQDIDGFVIPSHGNLSGWAKQGVLLLNACLTVRSGVANSHKDQGWETLTDAVIQWISANCKGVVFLLWGSYAQKKAAVVDKKKHHLLNAPHPSPLSAHRGFLGCKHFSKCNQLLVERGSAPIDWTKLAPE